MDLTRALVGVGVAVFMMVAPQLGLPYMEAIPITGPAGVHQEGRDGKEQLARLDLEVGQPVPLKTLDAGGNRSHIRVLWVEVDGQKLDRASQGQGKVRQLRVAVAMPSGLELGTETLRLLPGDELTLEGFQGKWAWAPDGFVGVFRVEGAALAARVGDRGMKPLGVDEQAAAPAWALRGGDGEGKAGPMAANVTVTQGRSAFVSTEAPGEGEGAGPARHVKARAVRLNGDVVEGTRWGEGALAGVAFTVTAPAVLKGPQGDRNLTPGQRVEVADFIGAYVVFHVAPEDARVALEGYARGVRVAESPEGLEPLAAQNKPPVAGLDWSPAQPLAGQGVRFWDRSTDADGILVKRAWSFGDGATSQEQHPVHAYRDDGTYTVTLTVTDQKLVSAVATRIITVRNAPPALAWAMNPEAPTALDTVQFMDGSADPDGLVAAWRWDFGDGATSQEQHPAHRFPGRGRYNVSLTVLDDDGGAATLARVVEVRNIPPVPSFTWGPAKPLSGDAVRFRDASVDPDGLVVARLWNFGDGSTSTEAEPTHTYYTKGPHRVTLFATDDAGATRSTEGSVDVRNAPPVADFAVSPDPPAEGQAARFTDLSRDPDGRIMERQWSFGDGSVSTQHEPTHTYVTGGTVTVSLTVRDDDGARSTVAKTYTINRRPVASFAVAPARPTTQAPVQLTDTSVDPDGAIARRAWTFGDGNTSDQARPSHQYARPGTYVVRLTVTDDKGGSSTANRTLEVGGQPPEAHFAWEPAQPTTADTVTFRDLSRDPDGAVVQRAWAFPDGTSQAGPLAAKRFPEGGAFPVTLTVTDDTGGTATVTREVVVNGAPEAAFRFAPSNPAVGQAVQFTDLSRDPGPNGGIVAWAWDFGDGQSSALQNPARAFDAPGLYTVRLAVTDTGGATASTTQVVAVGSLPPAPAFRLATDPALAGSPVQFVDESADADGRVVAWRWDLGDGAASQAQHPVHTYANSGSYRVRLTATDDAGKSATAERTVRILGGTPLTLAVRFVYADGQPFDVQRPGVDVALRDALTATEARTGGARPVEHGPGGLARATFPAGSWALGDPLLVTLRMPALPLEEIRTLAVTPDGQLGDLVVRLSVLGQMVLEGGSVAKDGTRAYARVDERIHGFVRLAWRDGVPVRGGQVVVEYAWAQLGGTASRPVTLLATSAGATDDAGRFAFEVPYTAGTEGAGAYLPGQHIVRGRADYLILDGVLSWRGGAGFTVDPLGLKS